MGVTALNITMYHKQSVHILICVSEKEGTELEGKGEIRDGKEGKGNERKGCNEGEGVGRKREVSVKKKGRDGKQGLE